MEEAKPAHLKSSLSLALRIGQWEPRLEMRMLVREPEFVTGEDQRPEEGEATGGNPPYPCGLRQVLNLSKPPLLQLRTGAIRKPGMGLPWWSSG